MSPKNVIQNSSFYNSNFGVLDDKPLKDYLKPVFRRTLGFLGEKEKDSLKDLEYWTKKLTRKRMVISIVPDSEFGGRLFGELVDGIQTGNKELSLHSLQYQDNDGQGHVNDKGIYQTIRDLSKEESHGLRILIRNKATLKFQRQFFTHDWSTIETLLIQSRTFLFIQISDRVGLDLVKELKRTLPEEDWCWEPSPLAYMDVLRFLPRPSGKSLQKQVNDGKWGQNAFEKFDEIRRFYFRGSHVLEAEIDRRGGKLIVAPEEKKKTDLETMEECLKDPQRRLEHYILYVVAFMRHLNYREFRNVVQEIISLDDKIGRTIELEKRFREKEILVRGKMVKSYEAIKQGSSKNILEEWQANPDFFINKLFIAPFWKEDGSQMVDFESRKLLTFVQNYFPERLPIFTIEVFDRLWEANLFFAPQRPPEIVWSFVDIISILGNTDLKTYSYRVLEAMKDQFNSSLELLSQLSKLIHFMELEKLDEAMKIITDLQGDHSESLQKIEDRNASQEEIQRKKHLIEENVSLVMSRTNLMLEELARNEKTVDLVEDFFNSYSVSHPSLIVWLLQYQLFTPDSRHLVVLRHMLEKGRNKAYLDLVKVTLMQYVQNSGEYLYATLTKIKSWDHLRIFHSYFFYEYAAESFSLIVPRKTAKGLYKYSITNYPLLAELKNADFPSAYLRFLVDWLFVPEPNGTFSHGKPEEAEEEPSAESEDSDAPDQENDTEIPNEEDEKENGENREKSAAPSQGSSQALIGGWTTQQKYVAKLEYDTIHSKATLVERWYLMLKADDDLKDYLSFFLRLLREKIAEKSQDGQHDLSKRVINQWKDSRRRYAEAMEQYMNNPIEFKNLKLRRRICSDLIKNLKN